jgi:hypothetical protein
VNEDALAAWSRALFDCGDPWRPSVAMLRDALSYANLPDLKRVRDMAARGLAKYGLAQGLVAGHTPGTITATNAVIKSALSMKVRLGLGTDFTLRAVTAQLALELGPKPFPRGLTLYHWNDSSTQEVVMKRLRGEGEVWWQLPASRQ